MSRRLAGIRGSISICRAAGQDAQDADDVLRVISFEANAPIANTQAPFALCAAEFAKLPRMRLFDQTIKGLDNP